MSSKSGPLVGVIVAVLIIAALGSIGYYQFEVAPQQTTSTTTTTSSQGGCTRTSCVNVTIPSGASAPNAVGYLPGSVTVILGVNNTVVWTNADQAPHTVTATDNSFNSHNMDPGAVYEHTFTQAGTYQYGCSYHGWMHGTVIVKSA